MSASIQAGGTSAQAACTPSDLIGAVDLGSFLYLAIVLLSLVLPLGIFLGVNNVRMGRRGLIEELEGIFSTDDGTGGSSVVYSFEMLRQQYETSRSPLDNPRIASQYVIPVLLFVLLCLIGFSASFSPSIPDCAKVALSPLVNPSGTLIGSLAYTFFGAYLWSVSHLIRRVANDDLSPISFFQASFHLLLATFVSAAIWHAHLFNAMGADFQVALAFLIGWFPDLFLGAMAAKFPQLVLKRIGPETKTLREDIPLDTILGIDPFIKLRLNEYEIMDVQNLATANPIKLFVETPYGLYEAIDWVAQAQLILAVGSANVVALRKHNIRTIFDLERGVRNRALNATLLAILRGSTAPADGTPPAPANGPDAGGDVDPALVSPAPVAETADDGRYDRYRVNTERPLDLDDELATFVAIIRDDLHVRRLRQIWDIVNERLNARVSPPRAIA